ncbi:hypothetical protein KY345_02540, partial [Candidatus Woesearchaeota archaeon]|nr:hypothetical protein [Candidatus Woesearchaeota archaeon]
CPNCPAAKNLLEEKKIEFELVDASVPEGLEKARKFNIAQVPTLVVLEDNKVVKSVYGVDNIEKEIS